MNKRTYKGFSLAEILVGLLIIGIISAAAMPLMTKMSQEKTDIDRNTIRCINESPAEWYKEADGTTEIPAKGTICHAAVSDIQHNRGRALKTAKWYADKGTELEKIMSKKVLRAACDRGGKTACDYFIKSCWKSGSTSEPYCDDEESFLDLTYYLHQYTDVSPGAIYIKKELEGLLTKNIKNLVNEVNYACFNNQKPDHDQNLGNNIACELLGLNIAWWIEQCNNDNEFACEYCYDNQYNRSCHEIKSVWREADTRPYKLTANGDPGEPDKKPTIEVNCNMTSLASAAISGCNALVPGDCKAGHDNDYNQSCVQIKTSWDEALTGDFKLTWVDADNPKTVYCDTTSRVSAAITGCGYNTNTEGDIPADEYVPGDCEYGRANNYNQTCDEIFAVWGAAPDGDYYHLTEVGDSPPDLVSSICPPDSGPPDPENTCGNQKGATTTFKAVDTGLDYNLKVTNCNQVDPNHLVANNKSPCGGTCAYNAPGCWYGEKISNYCYDEPYKLHPSGGCGKYAAPGYDKYLCTHASAVRACHALNGDNPEQYGEGCAGTDGECTENSTGWRLPTDAELDTFYPAGDNPLELCDQSSSRSPRCYYYGGCNGSYGNTCNPHSVWSATTTGYIAPNNMYYLNNTNWGVTSVYGSKANSVRCVRKL